MTAPIAPDTLPDLAPPATRRFSTVLRLGAIGFLALLLLVPLALVQDVLRERLERRDAAVREVTATWGSEQVVVGPILVVPYRYVRTATKDQEVNGRVERVATRETLVGRAYFLPETFTADARLTPDRLHRGIYEAVVYRGTLTLGGAFAKPSFDEWNVDPSDVLWDEAELTLAATDLRGAQEALSVKLGDRAVPLEPGSRLEVFTGGVHARLAGLAAQVDRVAFEIGLTVNGSRGLRIAPVGATNDVAMSSAWPDPSFQGAFLPAERDVRPDGFTARWRMSYYGRSYPQRWTHKAEFPAAAIKASLFGVDMVSPLDSYRFVERSIKYGVLVIVLIFTAFFLFEVLAAARVHPFQYTLVGAALCLFYLGLLALSEVMPFGAAYAAGAALSVALISLYCVRALGGGRRGAVVAAGLAVIYGFLYVVLRLQDYSLLVGTAGLFVVLALLMYLTRGIDWYARDGR
jgi:inner membrane protein